MGSGTHKKHLKTSLAECKQTSTMSIGCLGFPDWWGDRPRDSGRGAGLKSAGTEHKGGQGTTAGVTPGRDTTHAVCTSVGSGATSALGGSAGQPSGTG
ncbi:hypothetical protein LIER_28341 [Lithospermum erythrorhizon]|uniref:Uncharacterized protein n=1 Tax=Lithospermum erythrorhizon TaxID=34254 RepID=A0AAV3RFQ2_LITER